MLQHSVEKSRFASPLAVKIGAVAALAGLAIACSASPSDPTTAKTSEEISCTSEGIHPETCGKPVLGPTPKPSATQAPPPPPVTAGGCALDVTCTTSWSSDGFGLGPRYGTPTAPCEYDQGFAAQLTAMGCVGPGNYSPDGMIDHSFGIAWCPHAPVDTTAAWKVIEGCNTCTGSAPGEGWVLVAWADLLCETSGQPGGCFAQTCLQL